MCVCVVPVEIVRDLHLVGPLIERDVLNESRLPSTTHNPNGRAERAFLKQLKRIHVVDHLQEIERFRIAVPHVTTLRHTHESLKLIGSKHPIAMVSKFSFLSYKLVRYPLFQLLGRWSRSMTYPDPHPSRECPRIDDIPAVRFVSR
jgi:hypothetical protein